MDSHRAALDAYLVGMALLAAAIAGLGPPALAATLGVLGVVLMGTYAIRAVRSGYLRGLPAGDAGAEPGPPDGPGGGFGGGGGGD